MKTLKFFFLIVIFAATTFISSANEYNETKLDVESLKGLTLNIKQMVKTDFAKVNNFFYQNNIDKMKEEVVIEFFVNSNNKIKLIDVDCNDCDAKNYISQLLNDQKVKVDDSVMNRKLRLKIKLDYRT